MTVGELIIALGDLPLEAVVVTKYTVNDYSPQELVEVSMVHYESDVVVFPPRYVEHGKRADAVVIE